MEENPCDGRAIGKYTIMEGVFVHIAHIHRDFTFTNIYVAYMIMMMTSKGLFIHT